MFRFINIRLFLFFIVIAIIVLLALANSNSQRRNNNLSSGQSLDKGSLLCRQCNILLLNIELLRADFVGLLSSDNISNTPNIDLFFKNSIQFNNASSPAGETYRSNLSILTSREAFNFPVSEKNIHQFIQKTRYKPVPEELLPIRKMLLKYPTIAEHLKNNGYHTISMNQGIRAGKQLLLDRGFDIAINWSRRKVTYRQTIDTLLDSLRNNNLTPYFLLYRPEVLHPMPYFYPKDLDRIEDPSRIINRYRPAFSRYNIRVNHANSNDVVRRTLHEIYAQQLRLVDKELGKVFKYLENGNQLSSTIVILYSNHGSGLGDNGVEKLAVSYQSSIHVPLIIRHPAVTRSIRIQTPISLIDLMPTLLEMTGNSVPVQINGRSLLRDFNIENDTPRPIIGRNDFDEYIRLGAYKLIRKQGDKLELYNILNDPGELNNIAEQEPGRKRKMSAMLDSEKLNVFRNNE